MQTLDRDEVSTFIAAPPDAVYRVVADVTRTPEISPEVERCTWLDDASEARVGARFEAVNRLPGSRRWTNRPVVEVADPGREFAFSRSEPMSGTVVWRYVIAPERDGTRVTESYEVTRPISRMGWFVIERVFGGRDRRSALRRGMQQTLERLRVIAETEFAEGWPERSMDPSGGRP